MSSVPPPPKPIPPPPPIAASLSAPKRSSLALMPELEAKPQPTIPLSVTDLEVAGIRPQRRVWVTRLVLLLMFAGAGWACYHLLMTQRSTAAALNASKANHETTRQDLYSTRNRAVAAERRAEASDTQATTARAEFEAEVARLQHALGPEFTDAALGAALTAIEGVEVASSSEPSRLTVQIPPAQLFARNDDALSDAGNTLLESLGDIIEPANVDVWVEIAHRSRESATARGLAITQQLTAKDLPVDRIVTVTRVRGRANVELVIRPR